MKKIIVIDNCLNCPYCIVDDNEIIERWGKVWCENLDLELKYKDRELAKIKIPKKCPLTTYKD